MSSHRPQKQPRKQESFDELQAAFLVEIDAIVKTADITHPDLPRSMRPAMAVTDHLQKTLKPHFDGTEGRLDYRLEVPDLRNKGYFLIEPCMLYVFFRAWLRRNGINPSTFD